MAEQTQDPVGALLAEFGTRLNEVEEKQRLIKDRMLLIGENLVSTKEEYEKQISEFKKQLNQLNLDVKTIKQLNKRIIGELENFARKTEIEMLERQFRMFQPLQFTRVQEFEILKKEISDLKKSKK